MTKRFDPVYIDAIEEIVLNHFVFAEGTDARVAAEQIFMFLRQAEPNLKVGRGAVHE